MKRYKVIEVIRLLEADGWYLDCWKGDHRQFKHPAKKGESDCKRKTKHYNVSRVIKQYLETGGVEIIALHKNYKIMEQLNVYVSWSGKSYCACVQGDEINGIVAVANKTLSGLKKDVPESIQFHIEGCLNDGDSLPEWVALGQYELNYILEASALLHSLDGIITHSAISRVTGINAKVIGHYASGYRNPRPKQREKIISGIHAISRELASYKF